MGRPGSRALAFLLGCLFLIFIVFIFLFPIRKFEGNILPANTKVCRGLYTKNITPELQTKFHLLKGEYDKYLIAKSSLHPNSTGNICDKQDTELKLYL
jgi:hypothetical protein